MYAEWVILTVALVGLVLWIDELIGRISAELSERRWWAKQQARPSERSVFPW